MVQVIEMAAPHPTVTLGVEAEASLAARHVYWDLAAAGHLARGSATGTSTTRSGRDEPRGEVSIPNHFLTGPTWIAPVCRAGGRAPPIALSIDRGDMTAGI